MAVEIKLAPDEKLELVRAQITDATLNSNYFNVTELSDTFSGGKNAFLIAGSELLEPNTEVKVQIRDSVGKVLYCEFSDGSPDEYYEGISKVVAVYVYPTETAFGPATITLVGQTKDTLEIVKWQRTINIDPSLPNTTRVRFYKRPIVSIVEQLSPIYAFDTTGSKVASLVTQSFANIKVSQLDTFAGDVKRVKVYRTSEGDISDYDLIQDILVESKELLTTTALSGSVVGEAGLFTSETLKKLWNTGSLNAALTSSKIDNGLSLKGSGNLRYTSSLNLTNGNTYELGIDAFYSSSTTSNMGIYVSGSQNGAKLVGTLTGIVPTKNLKDQVFAFTLDKAEPTASLYLSQSQSEWHVGNISLKVSEDSAFSPSEISFVTSMPTVLGNETYNFKFEFYDVNNNYVPVAVTQSALFSGGNNNIGGTLILISGSTSASNASILALSQSVSGTIGTVTGSISQSFVTSSLYSASLQSSSLFISASVSGTISSVSQSASSSLSLVSRSLSSSIGALSSSQATTFSDVNSRIFTDASGLVNKAPSNTAAGLYLGQSYLGYHNGNGLVTGWKTYMANNGNFFLTSSLASGGYMAWDSAAGTLEIKGAINITGGQAQTDISNAATAASNAATAASYALTNANTGSIATTNLKIFTDAAGLVNRTATPVGSGLYMDSTHLGYYKSGAGWATFMSSSGLFYLSGSAGNSLLWNGSGLEIRGAITATSITLISGVKIPNASVDGLGSLATKSSIDSTYVTDLGTLATRNTVNQTHIDDNSVSTDKIIANSIVAGKIASLEFFGRNAQFNTGSVAGWNMDSSGLYKTTGAYTLRLASNAQKIAITQASNIDSIDRVLIDASTSIPAIRVSDTGSLYWSNSGASFATVYGDIGSGFDNGSTGYETANGSPSHPAYSGIYGIIGLVYGEENIFVEAENFPNIENTIMGTLGAEGGSFIDGRWSMGIRVRKFPTDTDAVNETNADNSFGINGAVEQQLALRYVRELANNSAYNVDISEVYGCSIPVTGGGGINRDGPANWYRIELIQDWSLSAYQYGDGYVSIGARRPPSNILVKFGRVNNGYSVFSPGGLQVYQGVRNYLNASTPSGSTGDESNFFIVKGKSQIIGSLNVTSGITGPFKNFRIEHPLNENKWLYHTATESPRADLIYRGTLQLQSGEGSVSIDSASNMAIGTFDVLTKNPQLFLQNNESFDRIKGYVQSGSVYVLSENQNSTASIDWSVMAERKDIQILKSPLYDRHGKYKTESYKGEYLQLSMSEGFANITGSI